MNLFTIYFWYVVRFTDKPVPITWPHRGDITFENVTLRYEHQNENVISNLNLVIPAGQRLGFISFMIYSEHKSMNKFQKQKFFFQEFAVEVEVVNQQLQCHYFVSLTSFLVIFLLMMLILQQFIQMRYEHDYLLYHNVKKFCSMERFERI